MNAHPGLQLRLLLWHRGILLGFDWTKVDGFLVDPKAILAIVHFLTVGKAEETPVLMLAGIFVDQFHLLQEKEHKQDEEHLSLYQQ